VNQGELEERLRVLSSTLRAFAESTSDHAQLLDVVARALADVVKDGCVVRLLDGSGWLAPAAIHLPFERYVDDPQVVAQVRAHIGKPHHLDEQASARRVLDTGESLLVPAIDLAQMRATTAPAIVDAFATIGIHSLLMVALRVRGESIGLLSLVRFAPGSPPFGPHDRDLAQAVADHAALAINNAELLRSARRLADDLRARVRDVEAANRELDAFAYVASHDLRAPLRDIANLSSWIADDSGELLAEGSRRHLATLRGRVGRMERMLEDLLQYSRVGRITPSCEDVRIADVVDDALALVGPHDGFAIDVTGGDAVVHTPRTPLLHVVRNLVHTEIKHHHVGRGRVQIEVARAGDGMIRIDVADDGPGIPARYHELVFRPFQTLRPRDEVEGSGLGLALVRKLVESAGGRVAIAADTTAGTRITLTWPERWAR
jgi:signal transduction histidine kinase